MKRRIFEREKDSIFIRKVSLLILLLFFSLPHLIGSGDVLEKRAVTLDQISNLQGLSNDSVTCAIQDRTGYLWIGTIYGLNRYDGNTIVHFKHDPLSENSLTYNWITSVYEDRNGHIWAGTKSGLNRIDSKTLLVKRYLYKRTVLGPKGPHILTLQHSDKDSLLLGSDQGVLIYDFLKDRWFPLAEKKPTCKPLDILLKKACNSIHTDKNGHIWFCTDSQILCWNTASDSLLPIRIRFPALDPEKEYKMKQIVSDSYGNYWISCYQNILIRFDPLKKSTRIYTRNELKIEGIDSEELIKIFSTKNKRILLTTDPGVLLQYDRKQDRFHKIDLKNRFGTPIGNYINTILFDSYDNMWLGIYGDGILKITEQRILFDSELDHLSVLSLFEDRMGDLWIGTQTGLYRKKKGKNAYQRYMNVEDDPNSIASNTIRTTIEDDKGQLWIGTNLGISIMNPKSRSFRHFKHNPSNKNSLSNNYVKIMLKTENNEIWIGTSSGLNRYRPETEDFEIFSHDANDPESIGPNSIYALMADTKNQLWVGTRGGGLNIMDRNTRRFKRFQYSRFNTLSISNNIVTCIYEAGDSTVWIGTMNGLNRYEPGGNFIRIKEEDGLPNNIIYAILEDSAGKLWISTNLGLCKYDKESGVIRNYFATEGLQNNEFNSDVKCKLRDGTLVFGGISGYSAFNPEQIEDSNTTPTIVLNSVRIVGSEDRTLYGVSPTVVPQLSYQDKLIAFDFAIPDYRFPKKNKYAVKLSGFDKDWNFIGNRNYISYTNLEPGNYTMNIKGADSSGTWVRTPATFRFRVRSPFWQRHWFVIILIGFIVLGSVYGFRFRMRRIQKQKQKLEELVERRTAELQKEQEAALQATRYKSEFLAKMSHEIRTPINSVLGFTEMLLETELSGEQRDFVKTINLSGDLLLSLINDILDSAKIETGELILEKSEFSPERQVIKLCDLIHHSLTSKKVELVCKIDHNIPQKMVGDAKRFSQVMVNLLSNAVKFTEEGVIYVHLSSSVEGDRSIRLKVSVQDTGIGIPESKLEVIFQKFRQSDDSITRKYGGSGLGLSISKDIAKIMGGDLTVQSRLGEGSTFNFCCKMISVAEPETGVNEQLLKHKRVLVIDDLQENLDLIEYYLAYQGAAVIKAINIEGGIDILSVSKNTSAIDLILVDIHMPEFELSRIKDVINRTLKATGNPAPLFALTSTLGKNGKHTEENEYDAIVVKPILKSSLFESIRSIFGSEKKITSPVSKIDGERIRRDRTQKNIQVRNKNILLAEDNPINLKLSTHILRKEGYEVYIATNGIDAFNKYKQTPDIFDLILMDIQMPEMDGKQATMEIRRFESGLNSSGERETELHTPIIALTAQSMKGDKESCLEAGMDAYISKPLKKELLLKTIERWIYYKELNQLSK